MRSLVADFETTTEANDCRVWAYGICDVNSIDYFYHGNTIDEFMKYAINSNNSDFYFHNLEFDGEFIIHWLLTHGYEHKEDRKYLETKTFTTLISDMGKFYTMRIVFEKKNKKVNAINIYDSNKIIPLSVKRIAKDFNLPIKKGIIDYDAHNGKFIPATEYEIEYLKNDVEIVARALQWFILQDFDKMTIGANALLDYKNTISAKTFKQWFPSPDFQTDKLMRQAYKGGFTWLDMKYRGKDIHYPIVVLDVNSLYPSRMRDCKLPFGDGLRFEGEYIYDIAYCLYLQEITCQFKLKPNFIPMMQIKHSVFRETEYLETSGEERPTLCLTGIDLELFFTHYDVYNISYGGGWKFMGSTVLFDTFIYKWAGIKEKASIEDNQALRTIAKLFMNNIYGKLSSNPLIQGKTPYIENGIVKYKLGEEKIKKALHIACGAYITAYARQMTISSAQKIRTDYAEGRSDIDIIYCDTDSLHCSSPRGILPEGLDIDPARLGAWKHEGTFLRGKFLRQKAYMECELVTDKMYNKMCDKEKRDKVYYWNGKRIINHITCAGMSESCHKNVTWENFKAGSKFAGKLLTTHVVGGIVLKPIDFTMKK